MGVSDLLVARYVDCPHKALEKHQNAYCRRCADKKAQPFTVAVNEKGETDFLLNPQPNPHAFSIGARFLIFPRGEIASTDTAVFLKPFYIEAVRPAKR